MRFKHFLNESRSPEQFDLDLFLKDCAPFLREIRGIPAKYLPKHGTNTAPDHWDIVQQKIRRGPRDSSAEMHDAVNDIFDQKFNWHARTDAIFISGDAQRSRSYGPLCTIFPIGEYDYLWSPQVEDLYVEYTLAKDKYLVPERDINYSEVRRLATQDTIEKVRHAHWHFNDALQDGLRDGFEIMLRAKKYYFIADWSPVHTWLIDALRDKGYVE